ncbi:hypothetical protein DESAMIL20_842 [Desulfurella amilsii]|uniref:Uncharacterized protein n=1 Tax=Desulfurella amilsii TaxID=1562698 RepID=A0A1X4XUS9_9BACT|nr:hypothetical protein DESAMIL20_842 [Desulfurella amilsii]
MKCAKKATEILDYGYQKAIEYLKDSEGNQPKKAKVGL